MTENDLAAMLKEGASMLGVGLVDEQAAEFMRYLAELKAWNKKMNLTSIDADRDIVIKHFLDSLVPCQLLTGRKKLLDMGSGAGFPGIALKIARKDLEVTLLDSVEKKVHFMRHIIRTLGLTGIEALAARAEDKDFIERHSGSFDSVISRAFSGLGKFLALGLPYLAPGGIIIAMKGPGAEDELREEVEIEGLKGPEVLEVDIPFSDRKDTLVVFRKEKPAP